MRSMREKTIRHLNLHLCAVWECDPEGWPITYPCHVIPERLTTFRPSGGDPSAFCHFFVDDYRFESLWSRPERYIPVLRRYAGAVMPDFSLYTDMPYPAQQWNHYRSLALMGMWQREGIEVVPNLNWSDERSLSFCCKGLPLGGTYAVGTQGCLNTGEDRLRFADMLSRCCERVMPDSLLMYGSERDLGIDPSINVIWCPNDNHERAVGNAGHRDNRRGGARK